MEKFIIKGGTPLKGEVSINGAKNAAVAILPATVLINGKCKIENIPDISDIKRCIDILEILGAKVNIINSHEIEFDCTGVKDVEVPWDLTKKFRASYYFIGALLSRFGHSNVGFPGGCNFGSRPIDQHIKAFEMLGAKVDCEGAMISAVAENGLKGNEIYLDVVSVGATINAMLAAVLVPGTTTIENAAKEPHIVDLANFLNTMGASIKGAGTDVIKITGVEELKGGATYSIVPDQIEAGTFMIAAAASRGDVWITNCITKHLDPLSAKLIEMGVNVEESDDGEKIHVWTDKRPTKANIKTLPYPGFPTDMQPQVAVLLSLAEGTSYLTEGIYDSRFQYTEELRKMGAKVRVEGKTACIEGVESLKASQVMATDLRAGAAMIIAGICADGETEIYGIEHVERGYERIAERFNSLGANITRASEE